MNYISYRKKSKLDLMVSFFYPEIEIEILGLKTAWEAENKKSTSQQIKVLYLSIIGGFLLHFYYLDPIHIHSSKYYLYSRILPVGLSIVGLLYGLHPKFENFFNFTRIWPFIVILIMLYFQIKLSTEYLNEMPVALAYIILMISLSTLNFSSLGTGLFCALVLVGIYESAINYVVEAKVAYPTHYVGSLNFLSFLFAVLLGRITALKSKIFIESEIEKEKDRKKIEELMDFTSVLRRLTDVEVFRRMIYEKKMLRDRSYNDVLDSISRVKIVNAVFLWSDVRGFTKKIKADPSYAEKNIFPKSLLLTDLVSNVSYGISDSQADLVYGFWDLGTEEQKINNSLFYAYTALKNQKYKNEVGDVRSIILFYNLARVGKNSSGRFVYTVISECMNMCNRIDKIVSHLLMDGHLSPDEIIINSNFLKTIERLYNYKFFVNAVDISAYTVHDFPEVEVIYTLSATANKSFLETLEPKLPDYIYV